MTKSRVEERETKDDRPLLGFYWRQFMTETGAEPEAWKYLAVVVPIVVFFGPVGSFVSSYFHRQVLAMFIYVLDTLALVTLDQNEIFLCIFTAVKNASKLAKL